MGKGSEERFTKGKSWAWCPNPSQVSGTECETGIERGPPSTQADHPSVKAKEDCLCRSGGCAKTGT